MYAPLESQVWDFTILFLKSNKELYVIWKNEVSFCQIYLLLRATVKEC